MVLRWIAFGIAAFFLAVLAYAIYGTVVEHGRERAGFTQVANGDAQFWLMQGPPNDRLIPCTIVYHFDSPLDETELLSRLKVLANSYDMFQRNVVEFGGIPYWQSVEPDWAVLFQILGPDDDMTALREQADWEVSQPSEAGEGLPLFRVFLSEDRQQLTFVWHHVLSDLEGMFNKHAVHLFEETNERTRFGYQISSAQEYQPEKLPSGTGSAPRERSGERALGFTGTEFEVTRLVLPVRDHNLFDLGEDAGLPMSDIFSWITQRTVTRYHANDSFPVRPIVSPLSLRTS